MLEPGVESHLPGVFQEFMTVSGNTLAALSSLEPQVLILCSSDLVLYTELMSIWR